MGHQECLDLSLNQSRCVPPSVPEMPAREVLETVVENTKYQIKSATS